MCIEFVSSETQNGPRSIQAFVECVRYCSTSSGHQVSSDKDRPSLRTFLFPKRLFSRTAFTSLVIILFESAFGKACFRISFLTHFVHLGLNEEARTFLPKVRILQECMAIHWSSSAFFVLFFVTKNIFSGPRTSDTFPSRDSVQVSMTRSNFSFHNSS